MIVTRTVDEVREWRADRRSVGLVPTMGAFHAGHLSLIDRSVADWPGTVVSLFVNPTQFNEGADLAAYPRQESRDFELAEARGVDLMFAPDVDQIYGPADLEVTVAGPALGWEGDHRPGHFNGVALVVAKLFGIVEPTQAYFGLKDLQQCAVIRHLRDELFLNVDLEFVETIREPSGLAMSSRNERFSPKDRADAAHMYAAMCTCRDQALAGASLKQAALDLEAELTGIGFDVEYTGFVDPQTMKSSSSLEGETRLIIAAQFAGVRLIDNIPV